MKKLLAILGSIAIMGSTSSLVVACNSNTRSETNELGSVFIDNKGEIKIDADSLLRWYQENKGLDPIPRVKQFNQLLVVGLMIEATNPESKIFYGDNRLWKDPTNDTNQYSLEDFPAKLKKLWGTKDDISPSTVQGAANNAFDKFEKDHAGKNSQASIVNELTKKFPYVKHDYNSLKRAWINDHILSDTQDGALAKLTQLLWGSSSQDFNSATPDRNALLQTFYREWSNSTVDTLEADINALVKDNWIDHATAKTNFINLINATGGANPNISSGNLQDWKLSEIQWASNETTITPELVKDVLARLYRPQAGGNSSIAQQYQGSRDVARHWRYVTKEGIALNDNNTYFDLVDSYPQADFISTSLTDALSSKEIFGFLTNSQRFAVDQYFVNEKPISLSEIVFKKAESGDLAVNIEGKAFLNPTETSDNTWNQFYGFYNFLQNYVTVEGAGITSQIPGTSQYNFDTIFGNQENRINKIKTNWPAGVDFNSDWNSSFYEAKNDDKLLTLSDTSHSNILRYSVYDFIQANDGNTLSAYTLDPKPKGTSDSIETTLVTEYGFDALVAQNIAGSIGRIENADLKTQAKDALYATLNLIEKLNRKTTSEDQSSSSENQADNKVYQVLNSKQGIIAFVDADGLHITKINGYDILNDSEKHPLKAQQTNIFGEADERNTYINQASTFKRLREYMTNDKVSGRYRYVYQDYDNQIYDGQGNIEDNSFIDKIVDKTEIMELPHLGVSYEQLNSAISNDYERFLVNNSILNASETTLTPFYKFNIFDEVKTYLTANDGDLKTLSQNNSWITDYVGTVLGFNINDSNDFIAKLRDTFMKFDDGSVDSQAYKDWISESLRLNMMHTQNYPSVEFMTNWTKWNEEIRNSRSWDEAKDRDLPLMLLSWGEGQSHIYKLLSSDLFRAFATTSNSNYTFAWKISTDWISDTILFSSQVVGNEKRAKRVAIRRIG